MATTTTSPVSSTEPEDAGLPHGLNEGEGAKVNSPLLASASLLGVALLLGGGYIFKDQIKGEAEGAPFTVQGAALHSGRCKSTGLPRHQGR